MISGPAGVAEGAGRAPSHAHAEQALAPGHDPKP